MLYPACLLFTSEPEACSVVLLWLKSPTSTSTTGSLLILVEQDPGLPPLPPAGCMLSTDSQAGGGSPAWAAFQGFLYDRPWWGWARLCCRCRCTRQAGWQGLPAPEVVPWWLFSVQQTADQTLPLWFAQYLAPSFQCCSRDPSPNTIRHNISLPSACPLHPVLSCFLGSYLSSPSASELSAAGNEDLPEQLHCLLKQCGAQNSLGLLLPPITMQVLLQVFWDAAAHPGL